MTPLKSILIGIIPYIFISIGLFVLSDALFAVGGYFATMFTVILLQKNKNIKEKVFSGWLWREGFLFSLVSSLAGVSLFVIWPFLQKNGVDAAQQLIDFNLESWRFVIFGVYLIFFNPIFEEIFWREILHTNTKADYVVDLLFAGYHIMVLPFFLNILGCSLAFIALIFASVMWRWMNQKYKGLSMPILTHFFADTGIIIFAAYLM